MRQLKKLMSISRQNIFQKQQFEIQATPEYNAMKTATLQNDERQIIDSEERTVKETIKRENGLARVKQVIKLPSAQTPIEMQFEMLLLHHSLKVYRKMLNKFNTTRRFP